MLVCGVVTLTGVDIGDNVGVWCCVTLTGVDISDNAGIKGRLRTHQLHKLC